MESSISSKREPPAQQAGKTTDGTHDGPRQLPKLTEIALTQNTNSVKLCSRCEEINLKDFFYPEATSMTQNPEKLLHLGKLEKETTCVLCQFFYSMRWPRRENKLPEETEAYALQSWLLGDLVTSRAYSYTYYAPSMVLCVLPYSSLGYKHTVYTPIEAEWIVSQSSTAAPFFNDERPSLSALPFSTTSINYPLLRAWCEHCDTHHSKCASSTKTKHGSDKQGVGPVVRCIDCRTREIVEIQTGDQYFALSYVWGEQPAPGSEYVIGTRETASKRGVRHLPDAIPTVIEDAMIMVTSLGGRYLWVDQYCIDQNDADDKHAQIGNMAAIYEGAYATIVAFSATDSASGLHGVRNLARKPCPSVAHPTHPLSALRSSVVSSEQLATSSVWMTRGWTFQEAILSRRLLIVTDHQVEFICTMAVWHECTTPEMGDRSPKSFNPFWPNDRHIWTLLEAITPMRRSTGKIPMLMENLKNSIEEYSGRHLTYQFDVLNALTGFLSRISTVTYLGIPIFDQLKFAASTPRILVAEMTLWRFLTALAWCPAREGRKPLQRRKAFPSWSWLGWEGRIEFPEGITFDEEGDVPRAQDDVPRARASVWIANQVTHTKGDTLMPLAHLLEGPPLGKEPTSILPHLNNYLWVEGQVVKMTFAIEHDDSGKGFLVLKVYHPPTSEWTDRTRIDFRDSYPDNLNLSSTMHERMLDCLLLVDRQDAPLVYTSWFLILDEVERDENTEAEICHYAVGSAKLSLRGIGDDHPWDDPSLRRMVKLC